MQRMTHLVASTAAGFALGALLGLAGCEQNCDHDVVCDAFEESADARADDCGFGGSGTIVIFDCPYSGPGPGSAIVCGSVWECIDTLDADLVPCDELNGMSLAVCSAYAE